MTKLLHRFLPFLIAAFTALSSSGCASVTGLFTGWREPPTVEFEQVVVRVSADYLNRVVRGDWKLIEGMVLWDDYLDAKGGQFTKPAYYEQLSALNKSLAVIPPAAHPLLNLDLMDVQSNTDKTAARVFFRKYKEPASPQIVVELAWVGRGWLVVDDTIFGGDGVAARILR